MFLYIILLIVISVIGISLFMRLPKFGKLPAGERLSTITESSNYDNNKFQNIQHTPDLTEGVTYFQVLKEFVLLRDKNIKPPFKLPSIKNNLTDLNPDENNIIWFGHSSYLLQVDGKKFLVDPVLSGSASPVRFTTRSFEGSDIYSVNDLPPVDYLVITHDHWDHLDYETVKQLKEKVGKVICTLGVAEHLEFWGFTKDRIIEKNWYESALLETGFEITVTPSRHFSGRGFRRQPTLWASYVLKTPTQKIFIGGDSGYGSHFQKIGKEYGAFDLVILECGQYNKNWKYIHMLPEETVKAAIDLNAKKLMPVHWAKFALAQHSWDDSINRVTKEATRLNVPIIHPMIGEIVSFDEEKVYSRWWEIQS